MRRVRVSERERDVGDVGGEDARILTVVVVSSTLFWWFRSYGIVDEEGVWFRP